jgi:predicted nucleotidyltransferase
MQSPQHGNYEPIQPLLDRIVASYHPRQVWLFGSRARGDAREDSDWDLLAVVDDSTPEHLFDPEVMWRLLELRRFYADVVVLHVSEFEEDADTPNTLPYPVTREGRLLYEHMSRRRWTQLPPLSALS